MNKDDVSIIASAILLVVGLLGFNRMIQRGRENEELPYTPVDPIPVGDPAPPIERRYGKHDLVYVEMGQKFGVDWRLLKAVAIVESNENERAVNPNDPSYGLMQILCTGDGEVCENAFPALQQWPPKRTDLFSARRNVFYGAQILAWNIKHYGWLRGIAVYNAWGARNDPPNGPFRNQAYVTKVVREFDAIVKRTKLG